MNINEQDYNLVSNFVNFVSRNAEFRLDVKRTVELYQYLNKIQQELLPKLEANILGTPKITNPKEDKNVKKT